MAISRFRNPIGRSDLDFKDPLALRHALLDFIADFSNWNNSTKKEYLQTARALTKSAHEAFGGLPGTRPMVVDPFAGGGSIPLEALRVGADAFASDLNPVAVLLNKVMLEYIPRYGQKLADEVRRWGEWINVEAEKELAEFYPKDPDGATPIAYLWARTIVCEGPGCGAEVPLMRSMWLAKKGTHSVALKMLPNRQKKVVDFEILHDLQEAGVGQGTVRRGSATCPVCGYSTPVASVRKQFKARRGGAADARLFCVVTTRPGQQGRFYRLPTESDLDAVRKAAEWLERRKVEYKGPLSLIPDEMTPQGGGRGAGRAFSQRNYGMDRFEDLFTPRQSLTLTTLVRLVRESGERMRAKGDLGLAIAVQTILGCSVDREAEHSSSLCRWNSTGQKIQATFGRQALSMMWDFSETNPFGGSVGSWNSVLETTLSPFAAIVPIELTGQVELANATQHPLPDDAARIFFTDPPYYDAVPYADLSDFFYVWLRRTIGDIHSGILSEQLAPKNEECIVDEVKGKDKEYFEKTMAISMAEGRRVLTPDGIGVIVFAHKSTSGWEAMLKAMIDAGWTFTGSWPIDTEMGTRLRAMDSAALASSIHLVCRPRENPDGSIQEDDVGYWSDVLSKLPKRIHEWLPGLASKGVVGADAIFSCLGPALEIYSRHSRVEKASGEVVTLKEFLEEVWAAVSREALSMIFESADATGFEEDARLTAMWLWTLSAGANDGHVDHNVDYCDEDIEEYSRNGKTSGFILEYDAARKIAQGLGCHLENLATLVEVKGDKARLLPVSERAACLFGIEDIPKAKNGREKKEEPQMIFVDGKLVKKTLDSTDADLGVPLHGSTTLNRLHQAMLLFADGRGDALKRFIIDDIGQDQSLWSLAQALFALYPMGSEERRWVEGVLTRKKSLGL
jgi:adenine-specific DNA methylase